MSVPRRVNAADGDQVIVPVASTAADRAMDDRTLAARARVDRQAFAELYRRHFDGIYWYCAGSLGQNAAEDATAQVFAKALAALPRYRDLERDTGFRAWLFRIAHNVIVDDVRARRNHAPLEDIEDVADGQELPDEIAIREEMRGALWNLVASLPPDQRNVVELRLVGLTAAEIAAVLGKSRGAVDTAQSRAVARLRSLMTTDDRAGAVLARDGSR
jgi:RNA polymerase sigma-70 factor, ECF subfamily